MLHVLIHQCLLKKTDLGKLKSDFDELNVNKLKNVPSGLRSLKSKVDKLDITKSQTTLVDLSKVSDVVKTDCFKKSEYDKLVKKVYPIQTTSNF